MATGRLGRTLITATATNTVVYTVPAGTVASLNILMTNSNISPVAVRVAITKQSDSTPLMSEYIEYGAKIPAMNGVLERTAIICSSGEKIVIWAATGNAITVRVNGLEEKE